MNKKRFLMLIALVFMLGGCKLLPAPEPNKTGPAEQSTTVPTQKDESPSAAETEEISGAIALEIINPKDGATVNSPSLVVLGQTTPDAEITINETDLKASATGSFSSSITLEEGENYISITASDEDGNYAQKEVVVNYEAAE